MMVIKNGAMTCHDSIRMHSSFVWSVMTALRPFGRQSAGCSPYGPDGLKQGFSKHPRQLTLSSILIAPYRGWATLASRASIMFRFSFTLLLYRVLEGCQWFVCVLGRFWAKVQKGYKKDRKVDYESKGRGKLLSVFYFIFEKRKIFFQKPLAFFSDLCYNNQADSRETPRSMWARSSAG